MNSIETDMTNLEKEILEAETVDVVDTNRENFEVNLDAIYSRFTSLQRQQSLKWAERARLIWVHNGDFNSTFFHNTISICNHHNNISHIMNS